MTGPEFPERPMNTEPADAPARGVTLTTEMKCLLGVLALLAATAAFYVTRGPDVPVTPAGTAAPTELVTIQAFPPQRYPKPVAHPGRLRGNTERPPAVPETPK